MFRNSRRRFLQQASTAGMGLSAAHLLGPLALYQNGGAATGQLARVDVDTRRTLAPLDRNLFGSFLEHLGRAIYEGIYDPSSKLSDGNGFRKDVLEEIQKLCEAPTKGR